MRSDLRRLWLGPAVLLLALVAGLLAAAPAQAVPPDSSVTTKIMCLCGCNAVLKECPHQNCEWGIPAKQDVKAQLAAGKTPQQVIDSYVVKYGDRVLAAPTKSGFNLAAWIIPFVVLIGGGIAIYFVIGGWAKRRAALVAATPDGQVDALQHPAPDELVRKMEDELKDFD